MNSKCEAIFANYKHIFPRLLTRPSLPIHIADSFNIANHRTKDFQKEDYDEMSFKEAVNTFNIAAGQLKQLMLEDILLTE